MSTIEGFYLIGLNDKVYINAFALSLSIHCQHKYTFLKLKGNFWELNINKKMMKGIAGKNFLTMHERDKRHIFKHQISP